MKQIFKQCLALNQSQKIYVKLVLELETKIC